jgi:hypothetical protein
MPIQAFVSEEFFHIHRYVGLVEPLLTVGDDAVAN